MPDPAELLLIREQHEEAHRSLSLALAAEGAGDKAKALVCYRKGQQHLIQGTEVPTDGDRQKGAAWDTARKLQQRMKDTLVTVNTHLSDLESSGVMKSCKKDLLKDLSLYPDDLASSSRPPQSSVNRLYPTVPAAAYNNTPSVKAPPPRPPFPAAPQSRTVAAAATDMADPGDQPPAYTPQPTPGHLSLAFRELGSGMEAGPAAGDGHVLLFIPSGVQMFFVAPNGQVSSLSSPGYLRIVTFESPNKDSTAGRPWTCLQVSKTL